MQFIKKLNVLILGLSLTWTLFGNRCFAVDETGVPVREYYTRDYDKSLKQTGAVFSDHAPIVYGNIGVWNIGQQGTAHPQGWFLYHKFANIIPNMGEKEQVESEDQYKKRLGDLAKAIHSMFDKYGLHALLAQELPVDQDSSKEFPERADCKTRSEIHRAIFKALLEQAGFALIEDPNDKHQGVIVKKEAVAQIEALAQDQALNDRIKTTVQARVPDQVHVDNPGKADVDYQKLIATAKGNVDKTITKMAVVVDKNTHQALVSVHGAWNVKPENICDILSMKAKDLVEVHQVSSIVFGGDFNITYHARDLDVRCNSLGIKVATTPHGESFSSASNKVEDDTPHNPHNVDLLFTFSR